jgi:ectoine hydroxylase-related dioxygenase (phytanoyl-CoA dioxygenase family)
MSKYHNLRKNFMEEGYCILENALTSEEIQLLLVQTKHVLTLDDNSDDFLRINDSNHIHKVKYMFNKGDIFLQYLVHNSILKIVSELSDDVTQIVPTWEDMLIKIPQNGVPVTVHQDLALQSASYDVFSVGIYLHDSYDNPVYYLPKSHKMGPLTKTEIYKVYDENRNKFIPIRVKAGDIVIHNVKTVHYSEENKCDHPRYTWYLEFRTINQLKNDSPWDDDWIMSRRAIWAYALQRYHKNINHLIPDIDLLAKYLQNLNLKISHTNEWINYDMQSPYNHFS